MRNIAVIGAGQMGTGIAQTCAAQGMRVMLTDVDLPRAEAGKLAIEKALHTLLEALDSRKWIVANRFRERAVLFASIDTLSQETIVPCVSHVVEGSPSKASQLAMVHTIAQQT